MSLFRNLSLGLVVFMDLIFMGSSLAARVPSVTPALETRAVFNDEAGKKMDADDPAIWVHPSNPRRSIVIGTLKNGGLDVYGLEGNLLQHVPADVMPSGMVLRKAQYNNVDVIYNLKIDGQMAAVAVVTDRANDMLRFFQINPDEHEQGSVTLTEITATGLPWIFSSSNAELETAETAYGLATTETEPDNMAAYAFVSQRAHGTVAKVRIFPDRGKVAYSVLTKFDLPEVFPLPDGVQWSPCHDDDRNQSQVEGMVVDDFRGALYLAQEQVGLWKTAIENPPSNLLLMDKVKEFGVPFDKKFDPQKGEYACHPRWEKSPGLGSSYLSADLEGLTIYDSGNGEGYLLASSQGSNEFAVYSRADGTYIGNFAVTASDSIDGSEQCDGAAVAGADFGGAFSGGLLVVQDGENTPEVPDAAGKARKNANFKFVRWSDIAKTLGLAVNAKGTVGKTYK
jgi:3-phytase